MISLRRRATPQSGAAWIRRLAFVLVMLAGVSVAAAAQEGSGGGKKSEKEKQPLHWSSKKTVWNRKQGLVTLNGSAVVSQPGETIEADHILLDLNNRTIDAVGNTRYRASSTQIEARELHFNLDTRTGSIVEGRVTNGQFVLVGERINKLGDARYQTHQAEYTTCHDCPGSWSFSGSDVDLTLEGYAFMSNVTGRVMGAPVVWFPYIVFPVKQERQTGLLFPKINGSDLHGFRFVQPFFWAAARNADMTFGIGTFTKRGLRAEVEGRYVFTKDSGGQVNFNLTRDSTKDTPLDSRWSLEFLQEQKLPFGIQQKLRLREVSDNILPVQFGSENGIPGRREPVLSSDLIFSHQTNQVSSYVAFQRSRNLLNFDEVVDFDPRTVQAFPRFETTTNDRKLFGTPVAVGLNLGVANFTRQAGPFDCDIDSAGCDPDGGPFEPGVDPVREATRLSVAPGLYAPMRLFDTVSFVPSAQYRSYFYSFHEALPSLTRGYLHLRADVSVDFERVYETGDPEIPRVKHVIRPLLSYSRIPYELKPSRHPFIRQIEFRNGYGFDSEDIVPIGTSTSLVNYFVPQGHSLSYGVTTQLIRRRGAVDEEDVSYQRFVELSASQTFNFLELDKPEDERVPVSRLDALLTVSLDRVSFVSQYYYYPYFERLLTPEQKEDAPSPHVVTSRLKYNIEKSVRQRVLAFERSFSIDHSWNRMNARTHHLGASLTWSLNDYWMPTVSAEYDVLRTSFKEASAEIAYQNASRCWKITVGVKHAVDRQTELLFDFNINLTGAGFGSISGFSKGVQN